LQHFDELEARSAVQCAAMHDASRLQTLRLLLLLLMMMMMMMMLHRRMPAVIMAQLSSHKCTAIALRMNTKISESRRTSPRKLKKNSRLLTYIT